MPAGRAMYIWRLKNALGAGTVDDVVARGQRAKLSSMWVKIADGNRTSENVRGGLGKTLQELVAKCASVGIDILGYHVPWCATEQSTAEEIDLLTRTVTALNLSGVVVDNEDGAGFFRERLSPPHSMEPA